ncbi:Tetrahydrofolate dehydrogenase/cyclohydrolase, NAD(P)-binding domain family protein [Leishmania donovani]|uniref:Tetrahydrofolate dehydrogenase/cyclohydrolase, NAD(P)-binding domain family protein n=1 Tax=Leishmania donovani TaxID=5661 RepID=A0A504XK64_LEIDO|nr:Tetrahydrofolate dehydrogenase/cyclohydrolase, NAD(P)-binding domain family protein [Leishmania donovani]
MALSTLTLRLSRSAELLSGVPISKELRQRIRTSTSVLRRPPCLVVVLVGDRADAIRYVNHKRRAAAECGIEVHLVHLSATIQQVELHRTLASVNDDVEVDAVLLQLPLPPHLRTRPALLHIHPGKDVDGLHPLNAGSLCLQDQRSRLHTLVAASSAASASLVDQQAQGMIEEMLLPAATSGGDSAMRHRFHERNIFVPCTALAIRTVLFSYLGRTENFAHLLPAAHSNDMSAVEGPSTLPSPSLSATAGIVSPSSPEGKQFPRSSASTQAPPRRDLHAVIVNNSRVVGVPTAALLQRAGSFAVTLCSRSNSLDTIRHVAQQADVLITAYGVANVFDRSFVREGAIVIDAAVNELPEMTCQKEAAAETGGSARKKGICGDVDINSVSAVAAAITKTPDGVGPLTASHLMFNVLKAYQLRHDNERRYNNIYTEFLKMYGTHEKRVMVMSLDESGKAVMVREASAAEEEGDASDDTDAGKES